MWDTRENLHLPKPHWEHSQIPLSPTSTKLRGLLQRPNQAFWLGMIGGESRAQPSTAGRRWYRLDALRSSWERGRAPPPSPRPDFSMCFFNNHTTACCADERANERSVPSQVCGASSGCGQIHGRATRPGSRTLVVGASEHRCATTAHDKGVVSLWTEPRRQR